jgi:transcriptional regulator with XRE-family HTH domain
MKGFSMSRSQIAETGALSMAALCRFLTRAFPASTSKQVEGATGIPASSVDKWLRGETRPSGAHLAALISVFGAAFAAAAMPGCAWLKEAGRDAEIRRRVEELFGMLGGG